MKKLVSFILFGLVSFCVMAQTPQVSITIDATTETTVSASFVMNDYCQSYSIMIAEEGSLDMFLMMGMTYEQMVSDWGISYTADASYTWTEQTPNTHFIVYALANGANSSVLCQTDAYTVTQGGDGPSVITITVSEIGDTSARVICTPNEETASFVDMLIEKHAFDSVGVDTAIAWLQDSPYILYETDDWLWLTLKPNTEYYALAMGKNADGVWGELAMQEFATTGTTGIVCLESQPSFAIYPNPVAEVITVASSNGVSRVELCDLQGRVVKTEQMSGIATRINVSDCPAGVYLLRVTDSEGRVSVRKVVVE